MADNADERIANEKLRLSLRKMIKSFDSYIKEASNFEQLEDNLKHMEETDEKFHKHDLVELLRDKIENVLGEPIEKIVNNAFSVSKFDGDIDVQNKLAQKICNDLMRTKDFVEFKQSFKQNVLRTSESLVKNFNYNFLDNNSEEITFNEQNENKSLTLTNDFDYLSLDNSLNQTSFVFVTSEQLPVIAQNLDTNNSDSVRLRAMQQLLAVPASDPQAAEHWVDIRAYLNNALKDPNSKISDLCLKLHSRTLASSHFKVSLEIYINLVEHLSEYFTDREIDKRAIKNSIDLTNTENSFLLRIFRLINNYDKDIVSKWTRYPESFVDGIIGQTLRLLTLAGDSHFAGFMTPINYIALIDIQANWFNKWMHGHDSRKVLLSSLRKNDLFLKQAINSILNYHDVVYKQQPSDTHQSHMRKKSLNSTISQISLSVKRTVFKRNELEYCQFIHSMNVVKRILCFRDGRSLFPIKTMNKQITIVDLIKTIIQIIFDTAVFSSQSDFEPSKYCYDLFQDLCVAEDTCLDCLCHNDVIDQLLKPLRTILQSSSKKETQFDENCMLLIANVLSKLASTQCGYRQLLSSDVKQQTNSEPAAHVIALFVRKALNNQLNYNISTKEIAEYLYIVRLLYSQAQGVYLIKEYNLNKSISDSWHLSDKQKGGSHVQSIAPLSSNEPPARLTSASFASKALKEMFNLSWSESLLDNLVSMSSTPKGVFYLNETGIIKPAIDYMFSRYKAKLQVGKCEKFGYGFIISQMANSLSGAFHLYDAFSQLLVDEIWTELEYGSDDFMSAFPRAFSIEPIEREVYKPMLCLTNILSSFSIIYELLVDISSTPRSFYDIREVPKGLIGLLDRVAILDSKLKISSLCNYEQTHWFGLRLLNFMQSDLDVMLLLETQYNLTELMLKLQRSNRPRHTPYDPNSEVGSMLSDELSDEEESQDKKKRDIVIDMLSVERNVLLVNLSLIGGADEKQTPSRLVSPDKKTPLPYPLFDQLPVPNFYVKKKDWFASSKKDEELTSLVDSFNYDQIVKSDDSQTKWLKKVSHVYSASLRSSHLDLNVISKVLVQLSQVLLKKESSNLLNTTDFKNDNEFLTKSSSLISSMLISNLQRLGVEKSINYGVQIGALDSSVSLDEHTNNLLDLHKNVKALLKLSNQHQSQVIKSPKNKTVYLNYCQEETYPGHDWFVSTIFLLFKGDKNSAFTFLYNFHLLPMSWQMWQARGYATESQQSSGSESTTSRLLFNSRVFSKNGISILLPTTCHYIEHILKLELPLVFSAFRMSGLSPSQTCSTWIKQCFWNYLNWPEISAYMTMCLVYGIDYQVYFCVALLNYLNEKNNLCLHHTYKDLQFYLRENQIAHFHVGEHLEYMNKLESKYRSTIMTDLAELFNARN